MAQEYGAFDLSALQAANPAVQPGVGPAQMGSENPEAADHAGSAPTSQPAASPSSRAAGASAQNQPAPYAPSADGTIPGAFVQEADDSTFQQFMQLSAQIPVVVDLWAPWCGPCKQLGPVLESLAAEYQGRFLLLKVNVDDSPTLAQAFGAQSIPMVVALLGGRPVPLFQGAQPKAQIKPMLDRLLEIAAQSGILAVLSGEDEAAAPQLSPEEEQIQALVEAGDLAEAIVRAEKALRNNPQNKLHYQALVDQLKLEKRLSEGAGEVDENDPMQLADQFFAAGNHSQAFQILLNQIAQSSVEEREPYRSRLVELLGLSDSTEAVKQVRKELAKLLF